jgi:hypothetical protein
VRTSPAADRSSRTTRGSALRPTRAATAAANVRLVMDLPLPIESPRRARPAAAPRLRLSPSLRRAVLTVHIIASVGLLGDCAAVLAVNVRAATTGDPGLAAASYDLLAMFSVVFGIPLSMAALTSGLALGLGTKWGVLRHRWVTAKLLLLVSVILAGALVIGPATTAMRGGDGGEGTQSLLILASAYDVLALGLATALSVFKPGRRRDRSPDRR